jgi:hypothetical protein
MIAGRWDLAGASRYPLPPILQSLQRRKVRWGLQGLHATAAVGSGMLYLREGIFGPHDCQELPLLNPVIQCG